VTEVSNKIFAIQIKNIRQNQNMTMEQFAEILGVTKSSINMWENKGVVPREEILRKIATDYNISLDRLLGVENADGDPKLEYLQRNLRKLDDQKLKRAENILKAAFDDIFEDEDEEDEDT